MGGVDADFRKSAFLAGQVLSLVAVDLDGDGDPDALGIVNPDGSLLGGGVAAANYVMHTATLAGNQTDQVVWDPTAGTSIVITDIIISVKGASADVALEWAKAPDQAAIGPVYLAENGGMAMPFRGLLAANGNDVNLVATTSNAVGATTTITVVGYEVTV